METPSSTTRRVTRSQTLASGNSINNNLPLSRKIEDSDVSVSKSRNTKNQQQDRSALIDITNDSPIVGLAMGRLETPSSAIVKQRTVSAKNKTPGSGEALLRGQVKTLLQKVEEEADLSKLSLESRPFFHLQGLLVNSPRVILAPTPMNTPLVPDFFDDNSNGSISPVIEEQLDISQVVSGIFGGMEQEMESEKSLITRSLLQDFSEKSETGDFSSECSSVVTSQQGLGESKKSSSPSLDDDDDDSIWSIQVNASSNNDEDEEEVIEENDCDYYDGDVVDELCAGVSKISVNEKTMPKFAGKRTVFVYNSDDEIVDGETKSEDSPGVVHLKGLPTPKGKHLRFHSEEDEDI
ncbi:hypothetical protein CFOL_v3_32019 [Cephalotus follicularis]|uniref:Uncharacterized protein n=1 Tax=Cephalotus follicularis TaxID=3775 RepID=A0A1Q3D7X0_CEPFO|nr:hypothetical protein CFOL_v3_32019 [Cephalotus follicularis]